MRTLTPNARPNGLLAILLSLALAATACGASGTDAGGVDEGPSASVVEEAGSEPSEDDDIAAEEVGTPEVRQSGAVLERPTHDVAPSAEDAEPTWQSLSMALWDLPEDEPDPIAPAAFPLESGNTGNLTSNAFGCESRCITSAQLSFDPLRTDVDLTVATNVATQKWVWVLPPGPFVVDNVPVYVGKVAADFTIDFGSNWATELTQLDSGTKYRIVVGVKDTQGNTEYVTTEITTVDLADQLVANGTGCYFQCITSAIASPTNSFSMVDLIVETDTDAEFDFAVSTSAPITVNGAPSLINQVQLTSVQSSSRLVRMRAIGLEGDTAYHVVVKVTDDLGQSQWATGSFKTDPAPPPPPPAPDPTDIQITFERIFIHNDGDSGSKGEISFAWRVDSDPQYIGFAGQSTLGDGDNYYFPYSPTTWVTVPAGTETPLIIANAYEEDFVGLALGCDTISEIFSAPREIPDCKSTVNVAIAPPMLVDEVHDLKRCSEWGISGPKADAACFVMKSDALGNDWAQFDVLVSFIIAD